MKLSLIPAIIIVLAASLSAQCTVNVATGGTNCVGPLYVTPDPGQNPTTTISFTAETAANPHTPGTLANPVIYINNSDQFAVDAGSGGVILGQKGDKGDQGIPGIPGVPGTSAAVNAGTVTMGAVGSKPTVNNTGTAQNAVFNFTIPMASSTMPTSTTCSFSVKNGTITLSKCSGH